MKIVVYDLASENIKDISVQVRDIIRACRVWSTEKLHKLGVPCTESVILVSPSKEEYVDETIAMVKERYERVSSRIRELGFSNIILKPIIRCLPITDTQREIFVEIAKRRIVEKIDETIERINSLYERIDEIATERRRRLRYDLAQLRREWVTIAEYCGELGIDVEGDLTYLIELIDNLTSKIEVE